MIGEPTALTIRKHIQRPSKALLKAFAGRPTGYVTDAFNGAGCLDTAIKPLERKMQFCGPAVTAFCAPMDNLAAMAVLDFVAKGDVIVIAATGDATAATVGDLWAFWAKRLGVAAIVCDGLVRDLPGLLRAGIPIFARGVKPNSSFKHGPGEINMGVSCGGMPINPGDILVGDQDGVVAVPLDRAQEVARQLKEVERKEAEAEARIKRGEKLEFWDPVALGDRVRYID